MMLLEIIAGPDAVDNHEVSGFIKRCENAVPDIAMIVDALPGAGQKCQRLPRRTAFIRRHNHQKRSWGKAE